MHPSINSVALNAIFHKRDHLRLGSYERELMDNGFTTANSRHLAERFGISTYGRDYHSGRDTYLSYATTQRLTISLSSILSIFLFPLLILGKAGLKAIKYVASPKILASITKYNPIDIIRLVFEWLTSDNRSTAVVAVAGLLLGISACMVTTLLASEPYHEILLPILAVIPTALILARRSSRMPTNFGHRPDRILTGRNAM